MGDSSRLGAYPRHPLGLSSEMPSGCKKLRGIPYLRAGSKGFLCQKLLRDSRIADSLWLPRPDAVWAAPGRRAKGCLLVLGWGPKIGLAFPQAIPRKIPRTLAFPKTTRRGPKIGLAFPLASQTKIGLARTLASLPLSTSLPNPRRIRSRRPTPVINRGGLLLHQQLAEIGNEGAAALMATTSPTLVVAIAATTAPGGTTTSHCASIKWFSNKTTLRAV